MVKGTTIGTVTQADGTYSIEATQGTLVFSYTGYDAVEIPIGDNFTMGVTDAVKAVELLRPKTAVPMHFDTFDIIKADPNDFVARVRANGGSAQVVKIGETIEY